MKTTFRHGIIKHQPSQTQQQSFLSFDGSYVRINADNEPLIYTIAHRNADYLFEENRSQLAWGPLTGSGTYYLFVDIDTVSAARSFGITTLDPVIGLTAPISPETGQHWYDSYQNTMKVWSGSAWNEKIRLFVAKLFNGTVVSMSANAPVFTGTTVGVSVDIVAGYIVRDAQQRPVLKEDNTFLTSEDPVYAQVVPHEQQYQTAVINGVLVPTGSPIAQGEAQVPISGGTVVVYQQFGKIVPADPWTVEKGLFGYVEQDTNTGDVVPVILDGIVSNQSWEWADDKINEPVYAGDLGSVSLVPVIANQIAIGNIIDRHNIVLRSRSNQVVHTPSAPATDQIFGVVKLSQPDLSSVAVSSTDPRLTDARTPTAHGHMSSEITHSSSTVDAVITDLQTNKFDKAGGQLYGDLILNGPPTVANQATNKSYVDSQIFLVNQELDTHTHPDILVEVAALYSPLGHNHDGTYAPEIHNHDSIYSQIGHDHPQYSLTTHNHDGRYALTAHTHSTYSLTTHNHSTLYAPIVHAHSEYALLVHGHPEYSLSTHNHTGVYSQVGHTHSEYALVIHTHTIADITNLQTTLDGKASVSHNHDATYSPLGHSHSEFALTGHNHDTTYAVVGHNHDGTYSLVSHNHDGTYSLVSHNHDTIYAALSHTHTIANITGLQAALDGKLALAGGTLTGFLTLHAAPTQDYHAATKLYVDTFATGLDFKEAVRVATTGDITLSGLQTIDGVSVVAGDRVLVKNQANPVNNGIYVAAVGPWSRSTDADGTPSNEVNDGMFCFVGEGATNIHTGWVLGTSNPITVGVTPLTFTQFSGGATYSAGTGIDITGNVISLAPHTHTISDISSFVISTPTSGQALVYNGSSWVNQNVSAPLTIQDEGGSQGTATTLNFVGGGVSATVSAGVATISVSTGGTGLPAGNDTNIQYNNAGALGGSDNFTWNNSTYQLTMLQDNSTFVMGTSPNNLTLTRNSLALHSTAAGAYVRTSNTGNNGELVLSGGNGWAGTGGVVRLLGINSPDGYNPTYPNEGGIDFFVGTSGTHIVRIHKTGKVGINTVNPLDKLHVVGDIRIEGTGNGVRFPDGTKQTTAVTTGTPGGSNTQIQYNNSGAFAGSSGLTWNDTTKQLTVVGTGNNAYQIVLDDSGATLGMKSRIGASTNGSSYVTSNAVWNGTQWVRDNTSYQSLGWLENVATGAFEFRHSVAGANPITWSIPLTVGSSGATVAGNLAFSGSGRRITGDFYNATTLSRTMFAADVANSATNVGIIPTGDSHWTNITCFGTTTPDNGPYVGLTSSPTTAYLEYGKIGTGTNVPLVIRNSYSGTEVGRFSTTGQFGLGNITPTELFHINGGNIKITGTVGTHGIIFPDGTTQTTAATGGGGGGTGDAIVFDASKPSHGFTVGQALYYTGTTYALAQANVSNMLGLFLVYSVTDTNNFKVIQAGKITGLSGLTAGEYYFVSDTTPGALTTTEPSAYSNPLLFALSATDGIVLPYRPSINGSSGTGGNADAPLSNPTIVAGVLTINLAVGRVFTVSLTQNVTSIVFQNIPAASGVNVQIIFTQDGTGGRTVTFPSSFKWSGGTSLPVTTNANAIDILNIMTVNGGTTWHAGYFTKDSK